MNNFTKKLQYQHLNIEKSILELKNKELKIDLKYNIDKMEILLQGLNEKYGLTEDYFYDELTDLITETKILINK